MVCCSAHSLFFCRVILLQWFQNKKFIQRLVWGLMRWSSTPSVVRGLVVVMISKHLAVWVGAILQWLKASCPPPLPSHPPPCTVSPIRKATSRCRYLIIVTEAQLQADGRTLQRTTTTVCFGADGQFSLGYMDKAGGGELLKQLASVRRNIWTAGIQSLHHLLQKATKIRAAQMRELMSGHHNLV